MSLSCGVEDKENKPLEMEDINNCEQQSPPARGGVRKAPSINDFEIIKPISRGAFGKVFLGHKKGKADQLYAIKVMKKVDMVNKNMVNQVIAERDALAVSKSPFIVRLFYSLQSQQSIYLVMEYMIGGDVKSLLTMYGYFDEEMAILYIAEVILALEYLHSHSIIHRDLKPDNMLICDRGHIKLTDFGLSKITLNRQVNIGDIVNTPSTWRNMSQQNYFRTPGQVLSLTSALAFNMKTTPSATMARRFSVSSRGSRTPGTPMGSRVQRASTPHLDELMTPPPAKSLTPTLQESLNWKSTTTDQSSRADLTSLYAKGPNMKRASLSSADEVLYCKSDGKLNASSGFSRRSTHAAIRLDGDAYAKHAKKFSFSGKPHELAALREPDTGRDVRARTPCSIEGTSAEPAGDNNTPHLYMDTQSLQGSYAAKHFRSLHAASTHALPFDLERNFEKDFLQDASMSSIELRRDHDSSMASPALSKASLSMDPSPLERRWLYGMRKKRPFTAVDTSPLKWDSAQPSHTGITMEFEAVTVGDEDRRKRSVQMDIEQSSSPMLRGSKFGFRSKLFLDPCRTSSKVDVSSHLSSICSSSMDPSIARTDSMSLLYPASISSIGSDAEVFFNSTRGSALWRKSVGGFSFNNSTDGTPEHPYRLEGVVLNPTSQTTPLDDKGHPDTHLSSLGGDQPASHPHGQALSAAKSGSVSEHLEQQESAEPCSAVSNSITETVNKPTPRSCSEGSSRASNSSFPSLSKFFHRSSDSSDVIGLLPSSSDSGSFTAPLPVSPDGQVQPKVTQANPFKTPSPAKACLPPLTPGQKVVIMQTPPNQSQRVPSHSDLDPQLYNTETSPMNTFSDVQSVTSDADLDSSLHNMSLEEKLSDGLASPGLIDHRTDAMSPRFKEGLDHNKDSSVSYGSSAATASTITPSAYNHMEAVNQQHADMETSHVTMRMRRRSSSTGDLSQGPVAPPSDMCQAKMRKKIFKKVTTFMSLPMSGDSGGSMVGNTPRTKAANSKHFMTPGPALCRQTPLRTPKSVRRRPSVTAEEDHRILGTPDYLAPELLLQKDHNFAVDWWALGVCLYEFLTGFPPFNDLKPELVFQNILNRDLAWPEDEEALSPAAQDAIEALLTTDPNTRPTAKELRGHKFFEHIDWVHLVEAEMPFVPCPDNATDTSYFDARNNMQHLQVSAIDM